MSMRGRLTLPYNARKTRTGLSSQNVAAPAPVPAAPNTAPKQKRPDFLAAAPIWRKEGLED
jgi:hypothetical protein